MPLLHLRSNKTFVTPNAPMDDEPECVSSIQAVLPDEGLVLANAVEEDGSWDIRVTPEVMANLQSKVKAVQVCNTDPPTCKQPFFVRPTTLLVVRFHSKGWRPGFSSKQAKKAQVRPWKTCPTGFVGPDTRMSSPRHCALLRCDGSSASLLGWSPT